MKKILIILGAVLALFIVVALFNKSDNTAPPISGNNPPPAVGNNQGQGLVVENVHSGDTVSSPLQITGYVNGDGWTGFEGQVGSVTLYDASEQILDQEPLIATSEWMTSTVRFEANLEFMTTAVTGKLVFRNENPSGEPSRDKQVTLNVKFAPAGQTMKLQAYFSNSNLDPKITCKEVFPVTRTVVKTAGVARVALAEMLKGPTAQEQADGFASMINPGVQINSLTIDKGVAKVDFDQTIQQGVGGSCRVSMMRLQIEQTLKQFSTVKSVIISVNGKTEGVLQP